MVFEFDKLFSFRQYYYAVNALYLIAIIILYVLKQKAK